MRRASGWWSAGLVAGVLTAGYARDVGACGGVFAPPASVQRVTDNSMVLSIAPQQTTLWTQPRYVGRAMDFSWVFPLRYTDSTRISLASDVFIPITERLTAPRLTAPTPPVTSCSRTIDGGGYSDGGAPPDGGVSVLIHTTLGPYDTVVLRGSDPMALRTWLQTHGYAVPSTIEPVLAHYTALSMDFVALRLRPGDDADRLPPIRITMPGALMRLPLRMIAAGAADHVRLSLVVFHPSRVEAMNFPNGELTNADLVWDWSRANDATTAFEAAFQRLNARNGGRLWLTESSRPRALQEWEFARQAAGWPPDDAGTDDGGAADAGSIVRANAADDLALAFGPVGAEVRVTRLAADLTVAQLDRDLDLAASNAGDRAEFYAYGTELNRPMAPVCEPGATANGCACRATASDRPVGWKLLAAWVAVVGVGIARRVRARR